ncbi:hypothetical protein Slin15195_G077310 [Septoria linicola]|uniref:Uncharacterized protein n=1 Tax=Septoria linicola TaxID=215465 RepID=A0A9Q9ARI5_9PEZI|nr:hypothetical protein Slin14017_G038480 [Septoria linicola]USW54412.1 hypothetical protein Slin15195_G077310 [Septoria linicola]
MEIELNTYLDNIATFLGMEPLLRRKDIVQEYRDLEEEKSQDTTTVETNLGKVLYKRPQLRTNLKSRVIKQVKAGYLKEHQVSLKVARKTTKMTHVAAGHSTCLRVIRIAATLKGLCR